MSKALKDQLKYPTECNDRQQGGNDLAYVVRQRMDKFRCDLAGVLELRNCDLRITSVAARIKNAEQQDREHGADAAQCDQAEAVILCVAVASYRSETNAERHDERNRDRAGRNTARIECNRYKFVRHKGGKAENCNIE